VEPRPQMHVWHILCLRNASGVSGRNNFNDFPDNQLTKFRARHTGMAVGQKEVAVWFQADQRSAGIPYRCIPSHFEPCILPLTECQQVNKPLLLSLLGIITY